MQETKIQSIKKYMMGTLVQRKSIFVRMLKQTRLYRLGSLDEALQAMTIINTAFDLQQSQFAAKTEDMVELLKLYGGYTSAPAETQRSASLKVRNKLATSVSEQCFGLLSERAQQLGIRIHTTRTITQPDINLSDEEDVSIGDRHDFYHPQIQSAR